MKAMQRLTIRYRPTVRYTSSEGPLRTRRNFTSTRRLMSAQKDWKKETQDRLTDFEKEVLWNKATERPETGKYNKQYPNKGYYACKVCGTPLYSWESKFDSGCGWPAFDKCYKGSVKTIKDGRRIEIVCGTCGGHLGHVFHGEKYTNTNERHCVNSVSLQYHSTKLKQAEALVGK